MDIRDMTQEEVYNASNIQRFIKKLSQPDDKDCIEFNSSMRTGYGRFHIGTRETKTAINAHRWAMGLALGGVAIDPELFVCHKCDNRKCVHPFHLFLGTNQDNMDDMIAKGRGPMRITNAKLTEGQVLDIRASLENARILSDMYNVCVDTIYDIKAKRTWSHI